jgi:hypothetical protein
MHRVRCLLATFSVDKFRAGHALEYSEGIPFLGTGVQRRPRQDLMLSPRKDVPEGSCYRVDFRIL